MQDPSREATQGTEAFLMALSQARAFVDSLAQGGVSPLFVAAKRGNLEAHPLVYRMEGSGFSVHDAELRNQQAVVGLRLHLLVKCNIFQPAGLDIFMLGGFRWNCSS